MATNDVIGYSEGQGDGFTCWCVACAKLDPTIAQECTPIHANSIGDFEGKDPGCYDCGEAIFDAPEWTEDDEIAERRSEYNSMLDRDFARLGLR